MFFPLSSRMLHISFVNFKCTSTFLVSMLCIYFASVLYAGRTRKSGKGGEGLSCVQGVSIRDVTVFHSLSKLLLTVIHMLSLNLSFALQNAERGRNNTWSTTPSVTPLLLPYPLQLFINDQKFFQPVLKMLFCSGLTERMVPLIQYGTVGLKAPKIRKVAVAGFYDVQVANSNFQVVIISSQRLHSQIFSQFYITVKVRFSWVCFICADYSS